MWKYRMAYAPQALLSMSNRWSRQQWKSRITYTPETFHPNSNFFVEPFSLSLSQCVCVCVSPEILDWLGIRLWLIILTWQLVFDQFIKERLGVWSGKPRSTYIWEKGGGCYSQGKGVGTCSQSSHSRCAYGWRYLIIYRSRPWLKKGQHLTKWKWEIICLCWVVASNFIMDVLWFGNQHISLPRKQKF
jgi:hypothetical protein